MAAGEHTIKLASASDFCSFYDEGEVQWPRPYRCYTKHSELNAEVARISNTAELKSADGKLVATQCQPPAIRKAGFVRIRIGSRPQRRSAYYPFLGTFIRYLDVLGHLRRLSGHAGHELAEYAKKTLPSRLRQSLKNALSSDNFTFQSVSDALKEGIEAFDNSIREGLLSVLPKNFEEMADEKLKRLVNDQESGGKIHQAAIRCMRGSTVIVALIDPARENIWTANLGDCQAIFAEADADAALGDFKATLMSCPHNAQVKSEIQRIQSEHPNEPEALIRGRVLGALAVTRAIGDHTFKLPAVYTHKIFLNVSPGYRVPARIVEFIKRSLTPPYVSATPEIEHRMLKRKDGSVKRKYTLVLCSDGLTDLYLERDWRLETVARQIARVCMNESIQNGGDVWEGLGGNLALCISKDALGSDLNKQSLKLTIDLNFKYIDDTTVIVLSWAL
ncbi:hypothetical protein EW145_g974 [Phellinidium pouzarii]|uniref:PPM-type phosphatase domain-containing protein n=1 Tax=Phellinidium pouzarii TaxID=167371 RepID=A0A4S4LI60_9AGAM|nr:hypothetical protein EW145_g974 [Phellinidium pouzarii]